MSSSRPCAQLKLILQDIFTWIDAPVIARLQSLASSLAVGLTNDQINDDRPSLNMEASLTASSVLLSMFVSPNAAIVLQIIQRANATRALSQLSKDSTSWKDNNEQPLCTLTTGEDSLVTVHIDNGHIFHATDVGISAPSFDITSGGSAVGLSLTCRPKEISSWEVTSEGLPVNLPDDFTLEEGELKSTFNYVD